MLTAQQLDQKFEVVPLGESGSVFVEKPTNQSEAYLGIAVKKVKRRFFEEDEIPFRFSYEDMVVLAARVKAKNIPNLHEIIWKFSCASGDVDSNDQKLKGLFLDRGRQPLYITKEKIYYEKRNQISYCTIRMCAMYLLTHFTDMSLSQIGKFIGGKHHSTIIHGRNKISDLLKVKDKIATKVVVRTLTKLEAYF